MTTKELIYGEIDQIEEVYLEDLYQIITLFVQSKQPPKQPSLMKKLRQIQIDAPEDFAANLDVQKEKGILQAVTFDKHSAQAGFEVLMQEIP